jgi:AdoMet-dependent heme synthase
VEVEPYKPHLVAFEVTGRCRFACRHCRSQSAPSAHAPELTTIQCKRILIALADYHKCLVVFTGSEPMERSDLYDLLQYARSLGLRTAVATCGYLIDESSIQRLKQEEILTLSMSLDGASAETHDRFRQQAGAFEAIMRAAEIAKEAGVRFQISTMVGRFNLQEIKHIAALAMDMGAHSFNPFITMPTDPDQELSEQQLQALEYEVLLNDLYLIKQQFPIEVRVSCAPQYARVSQTNAEKRMGVGCMGGRYFGFINLRGDVQTCAHLKLPAGNLLENDFDFGAIWDKSQLFQSLRDRSQLDEHCQHCDSLQSCGGCRARAFAVNGDPLGPDPLCTVQPTEQ